MLIFAEKTQHSNMTIAIIGGGAAGYFAAIEAKRNCPSADITIFEKAPKMLTKVEITGGGRCNLTNSFRQISDVKHAYPRGHKLMKRLFKRFDHRSAYEWFEREGVGLTTQDDECVFPQSQDSHSIIDCLMGLATRLGVKQKTRHCLNNITRNDDGTLHLCFANGWERDFDRVAITTGGSPKGEGLKMHDLLGHEIEPPVPSLFTFNIKDRSFLELMGTVVEPVIASIPGTKMRAEGPLLITHWGMSGPAALKLSSHAARHLNERQYQSPVAINWTGESRRSVAEEEIGGIAACNPQKQLATVRPFNIPTRLWHYIIRRTGHSTEQRWGELGKKSLNRIIETLTNDIYQIEGRGKARDEFVTCGGVSLASIDLHTLESKVCKGLFFAGEVLDVDAITGGFNLQAAWTMGHVVGKHIVEC